jgi:transcriptional regulator with XRE-family HTH domain
MSHTLGGLDPGTIAALEELGAGIRYLRQQQLLTQRVLAERCGLSQSTISRLENGLAPGVRVAWLARLFAALERDPGWAGNRPWDVQTAELDPAHGAIQRARHPRSANARSG